MIKYTYDANGNRIKKEVYNELTNTYDVTNYIYLENVLIGETHQDGTIIEYIYDDTEIIGFTLIQNNIETNYYYVKNIQGDIEKIVDNNKNIVATYTYDAYGNTISNNSTIANINPFRYRGYYFDQETNLYYCISRYYDSKITRFISRDDINYLDVSTPLGMNLYSYCINNPIRNIDSNGTQHTEYYKISKDIKLTKDDSCGYSNYYYSCIPVNGYSSINFTFPKFEIKKINLKNFIKKIINIIFSKELDKKIIMMGADFLKENNFNYSNKTKTNVVNYSKSFGSMSGNYLKEYPAGSGGSGFMCYFEEHLYLGEDLDIDDILM